MAGRAASPQLTTSLNTPQSLPRTDRTPVLLALPMKFSAKQVYLPSSDRLMFLIIKVPSKVTVTLQQGQERSSQLRDTPWPLEGDWPPRSHLSWGTENLPGTVPQNLSTLAPKYCSFWSRTGLAQDADLSPSSCRDQPPHRVLPEVWGQSCRRRGTQTLTLEISTLPPQLRCHLATC